MRTGLVLFTVTAIGVVLFTSRYEPMNAQDNDHGFLKKVQDLSVQVSELKKDLASVRKQLDAANDRISQVQSELKSQIDSTQQSLDTVNKRTAWVREEMNGKRPIIKLEDGKFIFFDANGGGLCDPKGNLLKQIVNYK